jgi:hypothetical protein
MVLETAASISARSTYPDLSVCSLRRITRDHTLLALAFPRTSSGSISPRSGRYYPSNPWSQLLAIFEVGQLPTGGDGDWHRGLSRDLTHESTRWFGFGLPCVKQFIHRLKIARFGWVVFVTTSRCVGMDLRWCPPGNKLVLYRYISHSISYPILIERVYSVPLVVYSLSHNLRDLYLSCMIWYSG